MEKVNLREALASLEEHWSQRVLGEVNGQLLKIAKGTGSTRWHAHEEQDELFLVYEGRLTIQLRDREVELGGGEIS